MIGFLKNVLELMGVVFLRFRLVPRIWCVWLVGVNAVSLYFIDHHEGQVVFGLTLVAVIAQTISYGEIGFTRILGGAHILWLPMFAWMATRLDTIAANPALSTWLAVLFITNLVSLIVDSIDVYRFANGERAPHYEWQPSIN
ncbi:MAG: hypothetical protein AB8B94_05145 [Hyphomicrobiales bacterium]